MYIRDFHILRGISLVLINLIFAKFPSKRCAWSVLAKVSVEKIKRNFVLLLDIH